MKPCKFFYCLTGVLLLHSVSATSATFVNSKVNGDDQFKIYTSASPTEAGFQYGSGVGWSFTYNHTLYLPQTAGVNYRDYWINVWVQDLGGGGAILLGKFTLTGVPAGSAGSIAGCKFDNGKTSISTSEVQFWKVSEPLPLSTALPADIPVGYSPAGVLSGGIGNYSPPWVQPTLTPVQTWWLPISGFSPPIQWITTATDSNLQEAWFSTHIKCPKIKLPPHPTDPLPTPIDVKPVVTNPANLID